MRFDLVDAGSDRNNIRIEFRLWGGTSQTRVVTSSFTYRKARCKPYCNGCTNSIDNCNACKDPNRQGN